MCAHIADGIIRMAVKTCQNNRYQILLGLLVTIKSVHPNWDAMLIQRRFGRRKHAGILHNAFAIHAFRLRQLG